MILKIKSIKTVWLFLFVLAFQVSIALFFNSLNLDFGEGSSPLKGIPLYAQFVFLVLMAPFFETIFFNLLPIKLLQLFFKNRIIIVLLASIVFSLIHFYSVPYMLMTYLGGIGLNFFYIFTEEKKGILVSFGLTVLLHSAYNLIGFLLIEIFNVL